MSFPDPMPGSVFYECEFTYACLAFEPISEGHTVVVWKAGVKDFNDLSMQESVLLMKVVKIVRQALLDNYPTDNVYITCLNADRFVHFHLIPYYKGGLETTKLLDSQHGELTDLSMVPVLSQALP